MRGRATNRHGSYGFGVGPGSLCASPPAGPPPAGRRAGRFHAGEHPYCPLPGISKQDSLSASQQLVPYSRYSQSYHDLLLTVGLGLRYGLCSRLAINFDVTTNRNLNHPDTFNCELYRQCRPLRHALPLRFWAQRLAMWPNLDKKAAFPCYSKAAFFVTLNLRPPPP